MRIGEKEKRDAHLDQLPYEEFMAALEEIESRQTGKQAVSVTARQNGIEIESEERFTEVFAAVLAAASLSQLLTRARAESAVAAAGRGSCEGLYHVEWAL